MDPSGSATAANDGRNPKLWIYVFLLSCNESSVYLCTLSSMLLPYPESLFHLLLVDPVDLSHLCASLGPLTSGQS